MTAPIPCEHGPRGCDECRYTRKLQKSKDYKTVHAEAIAAYNKEYHLQNRENITARMRARYDENPEGCRAASKAYRDAHPEQYMRYKGIIFPKGVTKKAWLAAHPLCGKCGQPARDKDPIVVDHDHDITWAPNIRGPLHRTCNVSLGQLGDNRAGLMEAVEFLTEWEQTFDTVWDFP